MGHQLPLLKGIEPKKQRIVNVASVPLRSPFRYPGGKTWLIPQLRHWLTSLPQKPQLFIEPFGGGGIISMTVAFEQLAHHVLMVELDDEVAAVWKTIIDGDAHWLAKRIVEFDVTPDSVGKVLDSSPSETHEKAFRTIVKNRVNRGGILAPGAGMLKLGENGKGLKSRWYATTLKKRILNIVRVRERITFVEGDGIETIEQCAMRSDAVFFIDPPYTAGGKKAGARLYTLFELDHGRLFDLMGTVRGDFLMTYDNAKEIRESGPKTRLRHGADCDEKHPPRQNERTAHRS